MNITVLAGGLSGERDVSLTSGLMCAKSLKKQGHNVFLLDVFMGYENDNCDTDALFENNSLHTRKKISHAFWYEISFYRQSCSTIPFARGRSFVTL